MTLDLTSEQEAMVLELAQKSGKTPEEFVLQTIVHLEFLNDEQENALIGQRIAEADREDAPWISHEEVGRRMGLI